MYTSTYMKLSIYTYHVFEIIKRVDMSPKAPQRFIDLQSQYYRGSGFIMHNKVTGRSLYYGSHNIISHWFFKSSVGDSIFTIEYTTTVDLSYFLIRCRRPLALEVSVLNGHIF